MSTIRRACLPAFVLLLAFAQAGFAQRYSFRTYSEYDGLTSLKPNSVMQDRAGFLWISTPDGLFRFDGRRFRKYGLTEGLPSASVWSALNTADGQFLVATQDGVARRSGDRFVPLEMRGLVPQRAAETLADDGKRLYVATEKGLFWIARDGSTGFLPGTEGRAVWSVYVAPGELDYAFEGSVCLTGASTHCYGKQDGVPAEPFGALMRDAEGTVWLRGPRNLVALPRGATAFVPRDAGLPGANGLGSMTLDGSGRILVPTTRGLARMEGGKWSLLGSDGGLAVSTVSYAMEDREGSLWIAMSGGGLARWLGEGEWENWRSMQGLPDDRIGAVARSSGGTMTIATATGVGVLEGDHVRTLMKAGPGDLINAIAPAGKDGKDNVWDGKDNVWIGTILNGLGLLNVRTGAIRYFPGERGPVPARVSAILVARDGTVWTGGRVIRRGQRLNGEWIWKTIPVPPAWNASLIYYISEDRAGRIWFGCGSRFGYLDGTQMVDLTATPGLPQRQPSFLTAAPDGSVTVAYNDSQDLYSVINAGSGFQARVLRGPASSDASGPTNFLGYDSKGNLWRGMGTGVFVLAYGKWKQYGRTDGLIWNDTSRNAFFADPDGSVWIGTSRGLSRVRSGPQQAAGAAPAAAVVDVLADGRSLVGDMKRIPYGADEIVIEFASPTFRHSGDTRFRYRLKGLTSAWAETDVWEAHYRNLAPGSYTFEVVSAYWNGGWSEKTASFPFVVAGPWWTAKWFLPFMTGLAAMLALFLWRYRERVLRRRAAELRVAVRERTAELDAERRQERERNEILETLAANRPLASILEGVAHSVSSRMPGAGCALIMQEGFGTRVVAASNMPEHWLDAMRGDTPIPPAAWTAPLRSSDPANDPDWKPLMDRIPGAPPAAICCSPIGTDDTTFGLIVGFWPESRERVPHDALIAPAARLAQIAIEHNRFYDSLRFQAQHDALTQLPNRILFADLLEDSIASASATQSKFALLYIDLDNFKSINDGLSHRAGDQCLAEAAARMKSALRAEDVVARIGGDEFNAIVSANSPGDAENAAKRIIEALAEPMVLGENVVTIGVSIGTAMFPDDANTAHELQRDADAAMYLAKKLGRNRVQAFGDRNAVLDDVRLEQEIRSALAEGRFEVHYQPKIASNGHFSGAEALIRLPKPEGGWIPPDVLIPVAESSGLIIPLGTWMIENTCRQIVDWRRTGFGDVHVAVNVSPAQMSKPDFADIVRSALARHGVPPDLLELELTESQILSSADVARRQMDELRAAGMQISIDDFGTGFSSLSYLHRLKVDAIKLDRSFVQSIDSNDAALRLVRAMIDVARGLGLGVIAEGVETEAQKELLIAAGCPEMQGYYFSRPVPAAALEEILKALPSSSGDLRKLAGAISATDATVEADSAREAPELAGISA